MASDIATICNEIVTRLDAQYPSLYEISRVTVPRFDNEILTTGKAVIQVVGSSRTSEKLNRNLRQYTYTVLIFIAQLLPSANGTDTDDLIDETIDISEHLEGIELTAGKAKEQGVAVTLFDAESLLTENNFRSLITLTLTGGLRSV